MQQSKIKPKLISFVYNEWRQVGTSEGQTQHAEIVYFDLLEAARD